MSNFICIISGSHPRVNNSVIITNETKVTVLVLKITIKPTSHVYFAVKENSGNKKRPKLSFNKLVGCLNKHEYIAQ